MPDMFDPYHQWLGIPPENQPPDHYRLLGLARRETNPEVIRAAADRQTVHLRSFSKGARAELAKRLLAEVADARACLLDPVRKAVYDEHLPPSAEATPGTAGLGFPANSLLDDPFLQPTVAEPRVLPKFKRKRRPWWPRVKTALIVTVLLVSLLLVAVLVRVALRKVGSMLEPGSQPEPIEGPGEVGPSVAAKMAKEPPAPLGPEDEPKPPLARTLPGHRRPVCGIVFTPDGSAILSAAKDGNVRLWDAGSGELRWTRGEHEGPVNTLALQPGGPLLATGGDDKTIRLWDRASGEPRRTLSGHTGPVRAIVFSPDGKTLASAGHDGTIRLWDPTSGETKDTWTVGKDAVMALAFSPDGTMLASGGLDGVLKLWEVESRQSAGTLEGHTGPIRSIAFAPDGATLATGSEDRTVILWDVAGRTARHTLSGHADRILAVAFSPDGQTLASAGYMADRSIRLWNPTEGTSRDTLHARAAVACLAFSPDGRLLASSGYDGRIRLWTIPPTK
ncbi:MAG: WD40 repeat domain-containing protein [Pirellulales bacterium]|nr:WD40 repeat domain-containing protein [Pirellulales bacterium]